MNRRPVSIKASLRLSLLGTLLVVVCTALIAHEFHRQRDLDHTRREKAIVFTEAVAHPFSFPKSDFNTSLRRDCRRLLEFPCVLAVSLWGRSNQPLADAALTPELGRLLREARRPNPPAPSIHYVRLPQSDDVVTGPAHLVYRPLPAGAGPDGPALMGLLLRMDAPADATASHFWSYHLPVGLVALASLGFGSWWLRRELVHPICALINTLRFDGAQDTQDAEAGTVQRHYELRLLAEGLSALRIDRSSWQQRARQNERRVNSRVAEETRTIIRDLKQVQRQAWTDPLTGIHNRRFLQEKFPEIFQAQRESRQDLSLVMFDLDHFKNLNDTLGHAAGDEILRFVGDLLAQCVRSDDFAARYGGDEFVVILPGVSTDDAYATTNRILALFAQRVKMMFAIDPVPTLSAGIASIMGNNPHHHRQLLRFADEALLEAKQSGRRKAHLSRASEPRGAARPDSTRSQTGRSTPAARHL